MLAPLLAAAFAILICLPAARGSGSWLLPAYYALACAAAFIAYARDKAAARQGRHRISERSLHLLSLLGGWPGALAAQRLLRHKTRKQAFQSWYWASVCGNCGLLGAAFLARV